MKVICMNIPDKDKLVQQIMNLTSDDLVWAVSHYVARLQLVSKHPNMFRTMEPSLDISSMIQSQAYSFTSCAKLRLISERMAIEEPLDQLLQAI